MAQSVYAAEVTTSRALTVWWAMMWRAILLGVLAGAVLGAIAGFGAAVVGRVDMSQTAGGVAGYLGSIPVSFIVLRSVLRKQYKTFTIRMVSRDNDAAQPSQMAGAV